MNMADQQRAQLVIRLLALDPAGLGGAVIRMRACPDREALRQTAFSTLNLRKLPVGISDEQLFGGVDLAASLALGKRVRAQGLLDTHQAFLLPMAERCDASLAARLAQHLDQDTGCCLIALDEGIDDEHCPDTLSERLAFHISNDGTEVDLPEDKAKPSGNATISAAQIESIVALAARLGIDSLRAPLFAVKAAIGCARLAGRTVVSDADVAIAAALTLTHRATQLPEDAAPEAPEQPNEAQPSSEPSETDTQPAALDDMLIEAIAAALPPGLLEKNKAKAARGAKGSGAGTKRVAAKGRPLPPRRRSAGRTRIDVVATLRAAAPWQMVRRKAAGKDKLIIRKDDIRYKRHEDRSDRLLIFTVDASGSAAMARLAEAKGAIEMMLADAYASRDHVALIAFRGTGAELLLPPTRSLVHTKRRLAALPGGGGTPLAAGLLEAGKLAQHSKGRGMSPTFVLLTDGRANVTLDGGNGRAQAQEDALSIASSLRQAGTQGLVIDTGRRPSEALATLSAKLDSPYIPMPHANAHSLQRTVSATLDA